MFIQVSLVDRFMEVYTVKTGFSVPLSYILHLYFNVCCRRAVKATFVLLPLFGVQLFVTIYRVPTEAPGGLEYERFSIVVNNLQVSRHFFSKNVSAV